MPSENAPAEELILQGVPYGTLAERVKAAVITLFRYDVFLLEADVNERSITHCLAVHLAPYFPKWHVDCEYNRNGLDPKTLEAFDDDGELNGINGSRVFPDIVIHRRGKRENLLVIEVKKSTSSRTDEKGLAKLQALRRQLEYSHALFLRFTRGAEKPGLERAVWC